MKEALYFDHDPSRLDIRKPAGRDMKPATLKPFTAEGIYIRAPFADMITAGAKPYETRAKNMLRSLIGHRVFIIETGHGAPMIIGVATITGAELVPYSDAEKRDRAKITGTRYDIQPGGAKYFYKLDDVERLPHPITAPATRTNHGRTWCTFTWYTRE